MLPAKPRVPWRAAFCLAGKDLSAKNCFECSDFKFRKLDGTVVIGTREC